MEGVLVQLPSRELEPVWNPSYPKAGGMTKRRFSPAKCWHVDDKGLQTTIVHKLEWSSPFRQCNMSCHSCKQGNNNNNNNNYNFITGSVKLCVPRPFSIPTTPRSSPGIASPLPDKFIQKPASKQNVSKSLRSNLSFSHHLQVLQFHFAVKQFSQAELEGLHHQTGHLDVPSQCFTLAYVIRTHGVPTRKVKGFSE